MTILDHIDKVRVIHKNCKVLCKLTEQIFYAICILSFLSTSQNYSFKNCNDVLHFTGKHIHV